MSTARTSARLRLRIAPAAEAKVRAGHPWIFSASIREQNREGAPGELAVIYDRADRFLAIGMFDPDSPIRVRILQAGEPQTVDAAWWSARLAAAVKRRQGLFDEQTTGHRLINGESDGWPGLVLDRYDRTLVLKLYTAAWLPRLKEISGLIQAKLNPGRMVLRLSRNTAARSPARRDGEILFGEPAGPGAGAPVIFKETGLRFEADVFRGQKTGFFLDQRENRRIVETHAAGRAVLNAFSFSGGFSLYAARGGARAVTDLDLSAHALAGGERNFALNQSDAAVARCRREGVQADAFEWLGANERRGFGLIILDPPSFAKREAERAGAIRAYERLVGLGLKCLARDGILVACSCSAHVTAGEFFEAARRAVSKARRGFEVLQTTRHAPDHPATFEEAEYLKAIYLKG